MYSKIAEVAKDFGISESQLTYIIQNEAKKTLSGDFLPCGDGDQHLIDKNGNPHRSRGIAQINVYYHPEVSDRNAYNVSFALEWTASMLRAGQCSQWTTCREYQQKLLTVRNYRDII